MERIPLKAWNRIEVLRQPIAAEATASGPGSRRWIAIYPNVTISGIAKHPLHLYYITDIEFDIAFLARFAEAGDGDLAIVKKAAYYVNDDSHLYDVLQQLGVAPAAFDAPWHVAHPLM